MLPLPKVIKNFILCLATIVMGFSYSGHGNTVTVHPGVVTELLIDSEESDKLYSLYFFQKFSIDHTSLEFTKFRFNYQLRNQNKLNAVGVELYKEIFFNLKPGLMQKWEIRISIISASLFKGIHNYFFPLPGEQFPLLTANFLEVGHTCNYETIQKSNKKCFADIDDFPRSNTSFSHSGVLPG